MGLFDSLKNQAKGVMQDAMQGIGNKTEDIVFPTVPDSVFLNISKYLNASSSGSDRKASFDSSFLFFS